MIPEIVVAGIHIPTFFLVISLSLSLLLVLLSIRVDRFNRNRKIAFDLALLMMAAGFLGGRLMHVFYEEWDYYFKDPVQILYFWNGGFVFFGGMIGCWLVAAIYSRIKKVEFTDWADFFTPILSMSHALGRLGCFLSGCCFGRYCEVPWSVAGRHPTALYLIFGELTIFSFLIWFEKKRPARGNLFMSWVLLHSVLRFFVEFYRDDFRGNFVNFPLFGHLSISQLICLFFILISAGYIIASSESLKKLYTRPPS
jgi:phosphatidylglycerol---prolipoprotein diacylglyceryl transferase